MNEVMREIRCKECGEPLDESTDLALEERTPCPKCGSKNRLVAVHIEERIILREKLGLKARHGKTGRPHYELVTGADLHRKSGNWMSLERVIDRENDYYKEVITDPETGQVIRHCEEPLSQHTGHGSTRRKKK